MVISIEDLLDKILRPHIITIIPYATARDEFEGDAEIFLDANENALGSITKEHYNRYPDPYQKELKIEIAKIKNVEPNQIFLGNGSDEGIDLLIRMACNPGKDNIIILPPTYGMYQVSADINNVEVKKVWLKPDFQIDLQKVMQAIDENTKIIWLCSPNNPTGNLGDKNSIEYIIQNFDGLVVVDEAYIDFSGEKSWLEVLNNYPNLIVLQTFSKAWGLAGLRLGMLYANASIIKVFNKIKSPYNINILTQQLLTTALKEKNNVDDMVEEILIQRDLLIKELEKLKIVEKVFPSDTNFLLVKFYEGKKIFDFLVSKKIIVRDRSGVKLCEGGLRISVGTESENKTLIETLKGY